MRWRILGEVQTWDRGRWLPVPARKERQLLAILLLRAGRVVGRGRLIDELWDEPAPASAARLLNHYVWRLRRLPALPDGALRTTPAGYTLDVAAEDTDHGLFGRLVHQARDAPPGVAIERLTAALRLWQGPALADARALRVLDEVARRLDEQRIEAMELLAHAQAAAGRHGAAVTVLEEVTRAEPFREPPWRRLLLALHRAGRRPDALLAYQRLWRLWTDQLGVEPSRSLQDLHHRILVDDGTLVVDEHGGATLSIAPAEAAVPRQLPGVTASFVGRADELAELNRLLDRSLATGSALVAAISGAGGIGKTTLALRWAYSVANRFPDGQLFLNLRGFDPQGTPTPPAAAVRTLLHSLDVAPHAMPSDSDAQVALWRSLLSGRRMIVILDNARDAQHVRPLVTGAAGCAFLVTSRSLLTGLGATHGAQAIPVGLLAPTEAAELLKARLGSDRVDREPQAAGDIIARCGNLPLALAIVAARAASQSATALSGIAADMHETSTLDALHIADPGADLRSVFSWSYAGVSAGAARLFRLLGLHPGADVTLAAAASLAAAPRSETRRWLAELTQAHLVSADPLNRYSLHDLLRQYAAERADAEEKADRRDAAVHRLVDHYLHSARAADRWINRDRDPLPLPPAATGAVVGDGFDDEKRALEWFAAEARNLIAVLDLTVRMGWDEPTFRLHTAMAHYLFRSGQWIEQDATGRAAVAAADRGGDRAVMSLARHHLARACLQLGRHDEAETHLRQALNITEAVDDDPTVRGELHHVLSWVLERQARHDEAFLHANRALELFQDNGLRTGQARALNTIAWFHAQLGRNEEAVAFCESSLEVHRKADHAEGRAAALHTMGFALHQLGHHHRALTCFGNALDLFRELELRYFQGNTLDSIADTLHAMGWHAEALATWQESLAILEQLRHPTADSVRAKLGAQYRTPRRSEPHGLINTPVRHV